MTPEQVAATSPFAEFFGTLALLGLAVLLAAGWALWRAVRNERAERRARAESRLRAVKPPPLRPHDPATCHVCHPERRVS